MYVLHLIVFFVTQRCKIISGYKFLIQHSPWSSKNVTFLFQEVLTLHCLGDYENNHALKLYKIIFLINGGNYDSFHEGSVSSVQSLSRVRLFVTPWIAARQASLSITNSQSSLRLTSIESVMPSSHLILCRPLFLLPQISTSIRVFSNESTLRMTWPEYWSFSCSIIPSKE